MPAQINSSTSGAGSGTEVFSQIEATAQYYPPATYAQLLTYYDDFILSSDPASGQFMPLTTTSTRWGEQSILFAVGIIPPAANVTGHILDRSASIASAEGGVSAEAAANATSRTAGGTAGDQLAALAQSYSGVGVSTDKDKFVGLLAGQNDGKLVNQGYFASDRISTCGLTVRGLWRAQGLDDPRLNNQYKVGNAISDVINIGRDHGAFYTGSDIKNGKYNIQPGDAVVVRTPSDDGQDHSHVYTVTSVDGNKVTSVDGGQVDSKGQQAIGTYNRTLSVNDSGVLTDTTQYSTREVVGVVSVNKLPFPNGTSGGAVTGDAGSGAWATSGSANAQAASQQQSQTAGSPLLSGATGQSVTQAQKNTIVATQQALANMASAPPLAMMVNPSSFSVKGEKIVNDGNWGRKGPIIEYWGDQQDKISGSGKVAGFFAMDTQNSVGPGLTRWARNYSLSYQNFQSLFQLYRNNGAMFLPDTATQGFTQTLSLMGSIYIYYDNVIYIGSFDSFTVTESDASPHTIEYSFEFTVRASFLLDRTDDAFDYGVPQIKVGSAIPVQTTSPLPFGGGAPPIGTPEAAAFAASSGELTNTQLNAQNIAQQVAARVQSSR